MRQLVEKKAQKTGTIGKIKGEKKGGGGIYYRT